MYKDGLTNNQAEYLGILSALKALPTGSVAEILSDSQLAIYQLAGKYKICDPELRNLAEKVHTVVKQRNLTIQYTWIPREQNKADKLLSRR